MRFEDLKIYDLKKAKPFYKAGQLFGWKGAGLGINTYLLFHHYYTAFRIRVNNGTPYYILRKKVVELVTKYDSYAKGRVSTVGVTPWSEWLNEEKFKESLKVAVN